MKDNMKNIKSQEDFDKQLLMAGDKFTVVHFFSPSCGACKGIHSKVKKNTSMHIQQFYNIMFYIIHVDIIPFLSCP
jgi:hypothetical protein